MSFFFVHAADPQYGLIERYLEKKTTNISWEKERVEMRRLVARINLMEPRPAMLVIGGDIVDAYPGDADRAQQTIDILEDLKPLKVPVWFVAGNHDIKELTNGELVRGYEKEFNTESFYSRTLNGVKFVVLNSQYIQNDSHSKEEASAQMTWLKKELSEEPKCRVLFQHIPPFIWTRDEPDDGYFNLDTEDRITLCDMLSTAGVEAVFCGHLHYNAGGSFDAQLEVVTTTAVGAQLGKDTAGARIVHVPVNSRVSHAYYPTDELPLCNTS